jgi:hypothetical protein
MEKLKFDLQRFADFDPNSVINGLYGFVYDENGAEIQSTQEFSGNIEFDKAEIKQAGRFLTVHKVMGGKGKGSIKFLKIDSVLQKKILDDPTAKFNYLGKLADPSANGEEAVMFLGVSFDSAPILAYKLGDTVEVDIDFTFDGCRYEDYIS